MNISKRKIIKALIFTGVAVFLICAVWKYMWEYDRYTIETPYGDKFLVIYDPVLRQGHMDYNNTGSRFYMVLDNPITKDDIISIYNSQDLRIYRVEGAIIFSYENDFVYFDGDLDENPNITSIVKENILSDLSLFLLYIPHFLENEKYSAEMKDMLYKIHDNKFEELGKYGFVYNESEISHWKYWAEHYLF